MLRATPSNPNALVQGANASLGTVSATAFAAANATIATATVTTIINQQVARSWGSFNGTATGTIVAAASYGVTSIVKVGTGTYSITFAQPFSNTGYALAISQDSSLIGVAIFPKTTAACTILTFNSNTGVATSPTEVTFVAFGQVP